MFEWCQHLQSPRDHHELVVSTKYNPYPSPQIQTNQYPKFALTATKPVRVLQSQTKRGIKTHFNKSLKTNRSTQVALINLETKNLVHSCTQTSRIMIQNPKYELKITKSVYTQEKSVPKSQKSLLGPVQMLNYSSNYSLCGSKQKCGDYKVQKTKQTKASNCLIQTNVRERYTYSISNLLKSIESCNITQHNQLMKTDEGNRSVKHHTDIIETDKQNEEEITVKEATSMQHVNFVNFSIPLNGRPTFRSIYGNNSIKNVESQFKLTDKKSSEHKYKHTPNRRILFRDRETVVSRDNDGSHQSEREYRVDQSILCEPSIRELFTPIKQSQHFNNYTLSLVLQNITGMTVSITEIKSIHMHKISQELTMYKQLSGRTQNIEGILHLYQTQMDHGCYLLIKQPFTQSLKAYLEHESPNAVAEMTDQIHTILQKMYSMSFYLRQPLKLEDMVVAFDQIKIHRLGIFSMNFMEGIELSEAVYCIKQEMMQLQL